MKRIAQPFPRHEHRGFTLIEVMIVVAIIGILAAIAYPNYTQYVLRSKRNDCAGALVGMAAAMERRFSTNQSYLGLATGGGDTGAPAAAFYPAQCPIDGGAATYNLTIAAATQTTFTLNAAPTGSQAGDTCGTLSLTETGVKGATGGTVQACW
ncbi:MULTISPECIES: type IV pilin protein [Denitromonas]|jgi:type IV pilus assembly protein PilE|uniref:Type IV pilin protein n=2 Tax=Denitromonas TaxID=139331 RepID=A0A558CAQ5_9RHOO|nr:MULTISPECIES: type IV pilin protein [Denitromonas]TVO51210.1 type IV pilin protein [Denitromonas halophila]TVO63127.1 type IV pilin protein [Denitromonas ohlonensis]TVT45767.1 MAG: type IV pilin protein [Denitromonas halophila]TVT71896.1 MAG: type IV pilin protein [Denitromonas halophila]TVT77048.1 MAG: type IV pilin protein [Denitromonas halophila]